ncbi:MAG TPA: cysteine desulfurase [Candidatus Hydrogenedentes bacterium]|nr:cysteine desulfurase [Candidatus Hydrogenedentota bacterium]HRK34425.1 cysteine desulfurase [Candidatus Hydrogenedentota bacterium]
MSALDVTRLRDDFPALHVRRHNKELVYLDNAATSQKPRAVIATESHYYEAQNANVHRGMHYLSEIATSAYEDARMKMQRFLGASLSCEIIFTRGTTEAINLVAQTYGRQNIGAGDEIIISAMEHHSNIVPWQMLCEVTGSVLRVIPITDEGEIILEEYEKLLTPRTKLVSVLHVSNALGTVNPVKQMTEMAHRIGVPVLIDGAQATPHMAVNVKDIGCDFYACSGHKMFGPTGIGVLFGRAELLNKMPPFMGGGDMILSVTFEKTQYNGLPYKFEAGTPNIAGVIGLGAAVEYVEAIGMERIAAYEHEITQYGTQLLESIDGVKLVGTARNKAGVLSFTMDNAHAHDIGQILSEEGVAIRAGHHCAQPLMQRFGVAATARASLAFYNTREDLDALAAGIRKVKEVFD